MTGVARGAILGGVAVWVIAVGLGMRALWGYSSKAGAAGATPREWPAGTAVPREMGQAELVMFVHPKCPCSEASVEELDQLMARCAGRVSAVVVATVPAGADEEWARTGLLGRARAIPGVKVVIDREGHEAARFGARTSGQVDLYDAQGRLAFRGGITGARGHAGDNAGLEAVVEILHGRNYPNGDTAQDRASRHSCHNDSSQAI